MLKDIVLTSFSVKTLSATLDFSVHDNFPVMGIAIIPTAFELITHH